MSLIVGGSLVSREGSLIAREGSLLPREGSLIAREGSLLEEKTGSLVRREGSLSLQGVGTIHEAGFDANVIGGISIGVGLVALGALAILVSGGTASPIVIAVSVGVGCEGVIAVAEGIRGGIENDFNWTEFAVSRAIGLGIACTAAGAGVYINSLRNASKQAAEIAAAVAKNAAKWGATRAGVIVTRYVPFLVFTASLEVVIDLFRAKIVALPYEGRNDSLCKLHVVEIMAAFSRSQAAVETILRRVCQQNPEDGEEVPRYLDTQLNEIVSEHLAIQNEVYSFLNNIKQFTLPDLERILRDSRSAEERFVALLRE